MKRFKRWVSVSVFAVALGVVLTAPIPTVAQAETLKELKAVAQADGLVVFRTGASETQQYRQANDKLEKIGIKIQLLSGSSTTLAAKEVASNAPVRHVSSLYVFSAHLRLRCVSWLHPVHRHPGPEVWYTLNGETCLETSEGRMIGRAGGEPVIVPGGLPMHLTATGTDTRRALVLILHDSSQPSATPANDWTPKGLCKN